MLSGEHLLRLPVLTQGSGEKFPSKAEFLTNIFEAPRRALYPSLRVPASRSGWFPPRGSPPPACAGPAGNRWGGFSSESGWAAERRPREILLPQGPLPRGMRPPLSSSQSPLSSVSACGENCARSLAPPLPTARGAAGAPFGHAKRETGRARSKRKDRLDALRRVRASARRGAADRCKRRFWPAFGHAIIFCDFWDCRPVADGAEVVGVVIALSLLLFSLPLAVPRGNWCNGRMWTSARKHKPLRPPG